GLVPYLQNLLGTLFERWPEHEVMLFCTPDNDKLFHSLPGHVRALRLPNTSYFPMLDAHASHLGIDVLFRTYPHPAELIFPLDRQGGLIPDVQHQQFPDFFPAETLRGRSIAFARALAGAGAVVTLSDHGRQALLLHPETRTEVVVISPALTVEEAQDDLTAE